MRFHAERQDTTAPGWLRLLELIEEAAADGREEFKPLAELPAHERRRIITLPASIARLKAVRHLVLYGSNLVRIPPEIGAMESLEEFTPYTSSRLHWFPYELTRCPNLRRSTVSTRWLYGNFKLRPQFPPLGAPTPRTADLDLGDLDPGTWGAEAVHACSVCAGPVPAAGVHQVWISLTVATDVLPLLVNACSQGCVDALPEPPAHYVPTPHRGGPSVAQPPPGHL
ncbi:leucine-rich repeat domain-containing protein [Streptomyces sp. NPDC054794]